MGMRTINVHISTDVINFIEQLRGKLRDTQFIARSRVRAQDFTRERQLTFPVVMLFILQKTVKSIQRHLHEFLDELAEGELFEPVTAGAFTHARAKLKHTAFIELNESHVLPWVYGPEQSPSLARWHGHRLLGVDSSVLRLPHSAELREQFGVVEVTNHLGSTGTTYPEGRMSVLYDVLNRVALDGRLESRRMGEVPLAIEQLSKASAGDVILSDRGFPGYRFLAWHQRLGLNYIVRCSSGSFPAAQELFRLNRGGCSKVVKLLAPAHERTELKRLGLPLELTVRFVGVRLPTAQLEVLATSLLEEQSYPTEEFLAVYHHRWGHETFYGVIKGRLDLENFSGQTVEAVRQDFQATLLLCNLETVLVAPTNTELRKATEQDHHPKQVNHAVAFHALKDQVINLLYSDTPTEEVIGKLQRLFRGTPVTVRPERKPPRRKLSLHRSYHFQRHVKKIVF
jgi:hypothetical protein